MEKMDPKDTLRACRYCFMCRFSCPTFLATKRESVTPRGYALLLTMIEKGTQEWTEDITSAFYQCSLCGLGREHCEYSWPEDEMVRKARAQIVSTNHAPQKVKNVAGRFLKNGEPWLDPVSLPMNLPKPEVLFLAGCQTREHNPEIIFATAQVLQSIGIKWSVLSEESCCGGGLYDLGFFAEAKEKAKQLSDQIKNLKPGMIVTGCAHCYRTLKEFHPAWGIDYPKNTKILHISEFLFQMVEEGRLKLDNVQEKGNLGYHDPCMLGRKMGVYEAPRNLIKAVSGQLPIELFHNKEQAECCGAGTAIFQVEPDVARKVASNRLERVKEAGIDTLVTACQNCKTNLRDANQREDIRVLDLVELVAQHLR
jgi:fumarate reductase (CoM/CoB) subunit B